MHRRDVGGGVGVRVLVEGVVSERGAPRCGGWGMGHLDDDRGGGDGGSKRHGVTDDRRGFGAGGARTADRVCEISVWDKGRRVRWS